MLKSITIQGFKSFRNLEKFDLGPINVLIGGNGAGKSNFIDFFKMLRAMHGLEVAELKTTTPTLGAFLINRGGLLNCLYAGTPPSQEMSGELSFDNNGYSFKVGLTAAGGHIINGESFFCDPSATSSQYSKTWTEGGYTESFLRNRAEKSAKPNREVYIFDAIKSWQIYQFHDTSQFAPMRLPSKAYDRVSLRFDASNLAAFLYHLKTDSKPTLQGKDNHSAYQEIVQTIQMIAPYFEDFVLQPYKDGEEEKIKLEWKQKGSLLNMQPYHLSDGTLRFICLATVLLQPSPPKLLIIDEPELGLHPEAIEVLAELIRLHSKETQFILATQSPTFTDFFQPEDIVTVNRVNGETQLEHLELPSLQQWLTEYSVGQLWQKNVIAGGPRHE
jgi:predicted ATPase